MSTSKGNMKRSRPQKYQNRTGFKNDLHDKSDLQKKLNVFNVSEVCTRCKEVIEWKIKYKKYKALSQPKTCIKCQQKTVKKAYHVMCRECALNDKVCAKCLKSSQQVAIIPPEPTQIEQQKLKVEMDRLIKSLPERKRRSFLRYMAKGNKIEDEESSKDNDSNENDEDRKTEESNNKKEKEIKRIPHSREALLKKIEELKLNEADDDDDDDFTFTDDDEDEEEDDKQCSDLDESENECDQKKI